MNSSKITQNETKLFNLTVEVKVMTEQVCEVSVEAETLEQAKDIVEQMYLNDELDYEIVDSNNLDYYIY